MIFQNPWAWLGLAAIAAPVVAHLLARRPARRLPFPTLRFLQAAALKPIRRDRLADVGLLLVRCAVVTAAVVALTQPLWLSPDRARETDPGGRFSTRKPTPGVGFAGVNTSASRTRPADTAAGRVDASDTVRLLAGAAEQAGAMAARLAAVARGAPSTGRRDRPIAVVFPQFEGRAALLAAARPINEPWMFDVLMSVLEDETFQDAVARLGRTAGDAVSALRSAVDDTERLLLVASVPAHSVASAALIGAALRAAANPPPAGALAADAQPPDERRASERSPAVVPPPGPRLPRDESDGRWWWAAALLLLIIEAGIRRVRPEPSAIEVPRARVA